MKSTIILTLLAALAVACTDSSSILTAPESPSAAQGNSGVVMVTNSNDAGPASLRAAIAEANASANVRKIQIHPNVGTIFLHTPIVFTGAQDLEIKGHKGAIDGSALIATQTNFLANGGGDLDISSITFQNAPGNGFTVQVPPTAQGTQKVSLRDVSVLNNNGHGIEINDQEDPDDAGNPDVTPQIHGNSNGSAASLELTVRDCFLSANGFGALDRDGLRVNEGGPGNLVVSIVNTRSNDNGADGIELDERGPGSVAFDVLNSHFARNGDFDQSAVPDKDDGFDVDEADAGDLVATVRNSSANDNFEEGFDFNENDAGDMTLNMANSEASRNAEEGVDLEEDDDFQGGGSMFITLNSVIANGNTTSAGDGGLKIRERGEGDLTASIDDATASENVFAGISIREQQAGNLSSVITRSRANGNGTLGISNREDDAGDMIAHLSQSAADDNAGIGIGFDENADGHLTLGIDSSSASGNGGNGIDADEASTGNLSATVNFTTASGNTGHGMNFSENSGGNFDLSVSNSTASGNTLFGIRANQATPGTSIFHLNTTVLIGNTSGPTAGNVPPAP